MNQNIEAQRYLTSLLNHLSEKYGHYSFFEKNLWEELEIEYSVKLTKPSLVLYTLSGTTQMLLSFFLGGIVFTWLF